MAEAYYLMLKVSIM